MPERGSSRDTIRVLAAVAGAALLILLGLGLWRGLSIKGVDVTALTPGDVERFVRGWGAWSAVASVLLMVLHSFLPLPAEIIPVANGMLFGPWLGIALTWFGAMLGAVLSFALARWPGRPFLRYIVSNAQWARLEGLSLTPGTLLFVRLVPLISFNLVNYATGLLRVPWWTFLWTTALGILPLTAAMVLLGSAMFEVPLWAWAVIAAALVACWLLLARWRRRQQTRR